MRLLNVAIADGDYPDSKVHGANMGPTWVLSSPGGPHVGPMNLAIWVYYRAEIISISRCKLYQLQTIAKPFKRHFDMKGVYILVNSSRSSDAYTPQ